MIQAKKRRTISKTNKKDRIPAKERLRCEKCGSNKTALNKPFCIQHLDGSEYVAQIQKELRLRETTPISPHRDNPRVQEILELLEVQESYTLQKMASLVKVKSDSLENVCRQLHTTGCLRFLEVGSRRGIPRKIIAKAS